MKKRAKNLIITTIVGAILLIGFVFLVAGNGGGERNTHSSKYSASVLSSAENRFNFGAVSMKEGKVTHRYELKNLGEEPIKVEKVYTSCMCTTAVLFDSEGRKRGKFGMPGHGLPSRTNIEVLPGQKLFVEAVFDPAAHGPSGVGLANRSIYLETNSRKSPKVELKFTAMVSR